MKIIIRDILAAKVGDGLNVDSKRDDIYFIYP